MNHILSSIIFSGASSFFFAFAAVAEGGENLEEFKQFMEHEYLPLTEAHLDSFLKEEEEEDQSMKAALQAYFRRTQECAVLMLQNRGASKGRIAGERSLATIAAACGKYEWMRECIENGDDILPLPGSGDFDSPLTLVISGMGDFPLRIPVELRLKEAEWMMARCDNVFAHMDLNILYMSAQASGVYENDRGAMFDFLLSRKMPLSWQGVCMLLSIEGSLPIVQKHHVLDALTDADRKVLEQWVPNYDIADWEEKSRYIRSQSTETKCKPAVFPHSATKEPSLSR